MNLATEYYRQQFELWPTRGRHILAQYDAETIIVYQAYRPTIGNYAIQHGKFGGEFSYARMSWIKPNFLWMMYRSGWGTKEGQEIVLGLRLRRAFFDTILSAAVASAYNSNGHPSEDAWRSALQNSDVRLQWDPDHDPYGIPLERRAIQLGLRGRMLTAFVQEELLEVIDMTEFVASQRAILSDGVSELMMPVEQVYVPSNPKAAARVALD